MPRARQIAKMPGKRSRNSGPSIRASSQTRLPPAASRLLAKDFARHHVSRSKLGEAMLLEHEALALFVEKDRALAAYGLRNQL